MILSGLIVGVASAGASEPISFRPAYWVDGETFEPTAGDFRFAAMAFSSPTDGWIVGSRYLLHIRGDELEVAFLREYEYRLWIDSLGFLGSGEGWAGALSSRNGPWPVLHYSDGEWRGETLPNIGWPLWRLGRIMPGRVDEGWALAGFSDHPQEADREPDMRPAILHYDHHEWSVNTTLPSALASAELADGCQNDDGSWWFVGVDQTAESGMGPLLARWDGQTLNRVSLSPPPYRARLSRLSCQPDGTAWALGQIRAAKTEEREILLLRYQGKWRRIALPAEFAGLDASAFAVVGADNVWVAASCIGGVKCRARFLHWVGGAWQRVEIAALPEGRRTGYSISHVHFESPDKGWAIANDYDGPGLTRGLVFHYRAGEWRNRNWNYHCWDAPWLGLFGH